MQVHRILMPTDFSACSNVALDHALALADHYRASLHLLHVVVMHSDDPFSPSAQFPDAHEIYKRLQGVAASEMKDLLSGLPFPPLEIKTVQRRAVAAAPAVVEYAEEKEIDLIIMGAHGRRGFRRFLLGSVAEEVVRLAPCPVLTLRGDGEERPLQSWRKLMVPFDFSDQSRYALETARDLAKSHGSELLVVYVVEPPLNPEVYMPLHDYSTGFSPENLLGEVRPKLAEEVEKILGPEVGYTLEILEGRSAARITELAEQRGVDLILISTHGRTGWQRVVLGSVTEKVVRLAGCPVLTLKVSAEEAADSQRRSTEDGSEL